MWDRLSAPRSEQQLLQSVHQTLPDLCPPNATTHCVVIVVLQRVSATYDQSQCRGVVAEYQTKCTVSDTHVQHKLPSSTSL